MSVTAKDIAKLLGISPSTVSMVLNNRPGISEERRRQVMDAARELGYHHAARPAPLPTENIGLLILKKTGEIVHNSVFYSSFIEKVGERLAGAGCNLLFLQLNPALTLEEQLEQIQAGCRGVIVVAIEAAADDLKCLEALDIPVVIVGNYVTGCNFDTVCVNNRRGVRLAAEHLYQLGHREIGFLASKSTTNTFVNRYNCYRRELRRLRLEHNPRHTLTLEYGRDGSFNSMVEFIRGGAPLPTAFIAVNDILAVGAAQALAHCGRRVPDDVSIIGFDDQPISVLHRPQLTTISVSTTTYAWNAVYLLTQRLNSSGSYPAITIAAGVELKVRESTAPRGR